MTYRKSDRGLKVTVYLTLLSVLLLDSSAGTEVAEFQYPCYVDVCTFPRQFCNSDKYERRCSPCTPSLCKAKRVPLACKYQCSKLNPTTTTAPLTTERISVQEEADSFSVYLIVAYNAILTTLFVILLIVGVGCYVQKTRSKQSRNFADIRQASFISAMHEGPVGAQAGQAADVIARSPVVVCTNCRQLLHQNVRGETPPSYRSYPTPIPNNRSVSATELQPLVTQPEQTDDTESDCNTPCRPETTEIETQTTPKSDNFLSFNFNENNTSPKSV